MTHFIVIFQIKEFKILTFLAWTSAPLSTKTFATSKWPFCDAQCSGVWNYNKFIELKIISCQFIIYLALKKKAEYEKFSRKMKSNDKIYIFFKTNQNGILLTTPIKKCETRAQIHSIIHIFHSQTLTTFYTFYTFAHQIHCTHVIKQIFTSNQSPQ